MSTVLCLTVRFLDPVASFHGRGDDGESEWPPSPLRAFQALVAAATARWKALQFTSYAQPALQWLETRTPIIVEPGIRANRTGYRMYVPNNATDLVTSAWARGNTEASIASHRVEKDVLPTRLIDNQNDPGAIHFLFALGEEGCPHFEVLSAAARSLTHLGWGVDMVAGNATLISEQQAKELPGERWHPATTGGTPLRVPVQGTLAALAEKYAAFVNRLSSDGFRPVPPLSTFAVVGYKRATESATRPFAAFGILKPDASGNQSFDTVNRARDVAAWIRHVTGTSCEGWPYGDVAAFVHGHDPADNSKQLKGERADQRFMYLPLPTINAKLNRVESIRRVVVTAPPGFQNRIDWIRRRLPGQELLWNGEAVGLLNLLPTSDWVLRQYTGEFHVWSTVTPVMLPGYDDPDHLRAKLRDEATEGRRRLYERLDARIESLLRKAIRQAGFSSTLADHAELQWRQVGFRAGVDLATRYARSEHHRNKPRYHVRINWRDAAGNSLKVCGPVAIGAGRYSGLGLFAGEE